MFVEPVSTTSTLFSALLGAAVGSLFEPLKSLLVGTREKRLAHAAIYRELAFSRRRLGMFKEKYQNYQRSVIRVAQMRPDEASTTAACAGLRNEREWLYVVLRYTKAKALQHYTHEKISVLIQMPEWPAIVAIEPWVTHALKLPGIGVEESEDGLCARIAAVNEALNVIQVAADRGALDRGVLRDFDELVRDQDREADLTEQTSRFARAHRL